MARSYIGTPYRHRGRNRHGLDCAGLLARVCFDQGLHYHDVRNYGLSPNGNFERIIRRQFSVKDSHAIEIGDWLMFWMDRTGVGQHIAMVTEIDNSDGNLADTPLRLSSLRILHAHSRAACTLETSMPGWLESRHIMTFCLREHA